VLPVRADRFIPTDSPVISPDGTKLAYVGVDSEWNRQISIRFMEDPDSRVLEGTEGARYPFWSPDSRELAFFAGGKLKRVDISGGGVVTICDALDGRGGDWSRDDVIVFSPRPQTGLFRVGTTPGEPTQLTSAPSESATHRWPVFLPDGHRLLFLLALDESMPTGLYLTDLDGAEPKLVLPEASEGRLAGDRLLYFRDGNLMALRMDLDVVEPVGSPVAVAQGIASGRWRMAADATARLLVYAEERPVLSRLTWFDRDGRKGATIGEARPYGSVDLSPDLTQALVTLDSSLGRQLWLIDLRNGNERRFTLRPLPASPNWSPDGKTVAFVTFSKSLHHLVIKPALVSGDDRGVVSTAANIRNVSWSPDGRQILYSTDHSQTGSDIHVVPADGSAQPRPIITTPADERLPFVSPDGRWLAYESDESGDREIFVVTYPEGERKRQVTTGNFLQLFRWSDDGSQLVYAGTDQGLWALPVERLAGDLRFDAPKHIFEGLDLQDSWAGSTAGDLQRAMFSVLEPAGPAQLELILNWQNLLDR
jgi:Tol biopolymer transport system component